MADHRLSIKQLPIDILLLILGDLYTARDRYYLSRTCRFFYNFMQTEGWRQFCRQGFPGVFSAEYQSNQKGGADSSCYEDEDRSKTRNSGRLVANHIRQVDEDIDKSEDGAPDWAALANSLTWQSRAWDRMALDFQALRPRTADASDRPKCTALAVHFQANLAKNGRRYGLGVDGEEMLVVGAGEDIAVRYRKRGPPDRDTTAELAPRWRIFKGENAGFLPGNDDVLSVSVVENAASSCPHRGILVGRVSGDIALLSAEPDETFCKVLARFVDPEESTFGDTHEHGSIGRGIFSIDISTNSHNALYFGAPRSGMAAVTKHSNIVFFPLPRDFDDMPSLNVPGSMHQKDTARNGADYIESHPSARFDMAGFGRGCDGRRKPYNARWMSADKLLAVGADDCDPLRVLSMTPTGAMELTAAYKLPDLAKHYEKDENYSRLVPSSIAPLPPSSITGGNGYLVISGWQDGTCRLQDVRTSSPFDMFYQNSNHGLAHYAQSILPWGTERFLTGTSTLAEINVFDLRWPRGYSYTESLKCSPSFPAPMPPVPSSHPGSMTHQFLGGKPKAKDIQALLSVMPSFMSPALRTVENWPPEMPKLPLGIPAIGKCDPMANVCCRFHAASRGLFFRCSASFHLTEALPQLGHDLAPRTGVSSLVSALTTDLAPANFYAALDDGVVEGFLHEDIVPFPGPTFPAKDRRQPAHSIWTKGGTAPYFGYPKISMTSEAASDDTSDYYETVSLKVALMDLGDSMAQADDNTQSKWLPRIRTRQSGFGRVHTPHGAGQSNPDRLGGFMNLKNSPSQELYDEWCGVSDGMMDNASFEERRWHRLDYGLQYDDDFIRTLTTWGDEY